MRLTGWGFIAMWKARRQIRRDNLALNVKCLESWYDATYWDNPDEPPPVIMTVIRGG